MLYCHMIYDIVLIDIFIFFYHNLVIKFENFFLENTICILFTEIIICNAFKTVIQYFLYIIHVHTYIDFT